MNTDENLLVAFKTICNFVNDLANEYGNKHKPLKLYQRLINKTQISHDQIIKKHIGIYYDFCINNRDSIYNKNSNDLKIDKIIYSDRVYIDMKYIFNISDSDNSNCIWNHLLALSAVLDPTGKAKELLKNNMKNENTTENKFLFNMINKVESSIKPGSNPMENLNTIMQSNLIPEFMENFQQEMSSGNLDMKKLLGAVQNMVTNLNEQTTENSEHKQSMTMINNMSSMLSMIQNTDSQNTDSQNDNNQPVEMNNLLQMFGQFMGNGMNNKIEENKK